MGSMESKEEAQQQDVHAQNVQQESCSNKDRRDATANGPDIKIKQEDDSQGHSQSKLKVPDHQAPPPPMFLPSENPNVERLREAVYVRYLFEDFVLSPSRTTKSGWLDVLLPQAYAASGKNATLSLAVRAAAYAYMGNRRKAPELQIEARELYGRCLKVLASDLTSLEVASSNDTAAAVLVLGLYECIAGNGSGSFWHSHGHGLSLLMQLRNSQISQAASSQSKEEVPDGMIICQMQRRNLDLRVAPSPEEGTYIKHLDGANPAHRMFGAAFQCSHIVARAHEEICKADGSPNSRLEKVVAEIQVFDSSLVRLFRTCVTLSPTDKYRTDAELQAQWLASCPTYRAMAMWIFLKASRIILQAIYIQCLDKLNVPCDEMDEALRILKQSTDAIFCAVPFMVDPPRESLYTINCRGPRCIGGYYLLWPLHVIAESKLTDVSQQKRARDILLRIGSEMGLNHALEIARVVE